MNFLERRDSKRHCCEGAIAGKGDGESDGEKMVGARLLVRKLSFGPLVHVEPLR